MEGSGGLTGCMVGFPEHPSPPPSWVEGLGELCHPPSQMCRSHPSQGEVCVGHVLIFRFRFPACIFGMWRKPKCWFHEATEL